MSTKGGTSPEITLNFEIETNQIRCDQRLIEPGKRNVGNSGCPLPSRARRFPAKSIPKNQNICTKY
jgi:hypothetical protein